MACTGELGGGSLTILQNADDTIGEYQPMNGQQISKHGAFFSEIYVARGGGLLYKPEISCHLLNFKQLRRVHSGLVAEQRNIYSQQALVCIQFQIWAKLVDRSKQSKTRKTEPKLTNL